MLESKGILPPMIHGLFRISCSRNPKNIRNPPYSGYFLMFYGFQNHAFSCKHEKHNLLILVSNILLNTKSIVRDDSRNVKWEGGAKYKNNSKRTCLLTQTSPFMEVRCSVLRAPATAASIRNPGCRPTYPYWLARPMSMTRRMQACTPHGRCTGLS